MSLGEFIPSSSTKLLLHLNGNSNDSSSSGNNGTDTDITWVDGKFGKCASFNGSSSKITIPYNSSINFTSVMTIGAWIKPTSTCVAGGKISWILGSRVNVNKFQFSLQSGVLDGTVWQSNGTTVATSSGAALSADTLYHVMLIANGTTVKTYLNGNEYGTVNYNGTIISSTNNLYIGQADDDANRFFQGLIDEVIIENRAWSASEVKKYYTNSRGFYATL